MRTVGIVTTVAAGVILAVAAVTVLRSSADVRRYLKIRKM
jgi:hypothetical protein